MSGMIEERLRKLGIELPSPSVPPAIYSPYHVYNGTVSISGQPPYWNGALMFTGKVGTTLTLEDGQRSARLSALNVLSHLKTACNGDLDRVTGCVRMLVLVNAAEEFTDVHRVADGASALLANVFSHLPPPTRSSLGCSTLPMGIATEVEVTFTITTEQMIRH